MEEFELEDDLTVFHYSADETRFLYREIFLERCYLKHDIVLPSGGCVFDVGANIGMASLFFAKEQPNVVIYAFEPAPPIWSVLKANMERFGVNARLFDCALSDHTGKQTFTMYPTNSLSSGLHVDATEEMRTYKTVLLNRGFAEDYADELLRGRFATTDVTCEAKTLSAVLREEQVRAVDLLKIDVEKAEAEVLAGIDAADWPRIAQLIIEVHDVNGRLAEVRALLANHGYTVHVDQDPILERTGMFNVFARRT